MISFWRIFSLEILALLRSKTVAMLTIISIVWMFVFPFVVRGDGTDEGARELYVHFSLGGVFALVLIALLASAAGSIARERAAKRLQLTLVRPVRYFSVALGKILAHVAAGAFVLAVASVILLFKTNVMRPCWHVLAPVLPSPREEALTMYDVYMKDPETPESVKKASKKEVLRLLAQRAVDHYQTIVTNSTVSWHFNSPSLTGAPSQLSVRMRFTNAMEMRQDVIGVFHFREAMTAVSNITQAVLTIPLSSRGEKVDVDDSVLSFENHGKSALMLRPRRDINLLVPADSFSWNLIRAYLGLVAILAFVVSGGVLLSAALGRPVALFVAFVILIVSEMSPSVVAQYPDTLETDFADRIGLYITRFSIEVTRPVSSLSPLEQLAKDECIERPALLWTCFADFIVLPFLFSLIAALVLPRKHDEV